MNAYAISNWTIMIYLDADNDLEEDGIDDFLEIAATGSDEHINYVVQMDRIDGHSNSYDNWTDCKRFYIEKNMTPESQNAVESLGEVNMGDPDTLTNFIQWSMTNYPAQQYALILWDHGDGWERRRTKSSVLKGICFDDTSGFNGNLSMLDIKQVLVDLPKKPDLVGFDACLMGMIENAYMLKLAGIKVMVGSEETEPAAGWPYDTISQGLQSNPDWQPSQLGEWIVEQYYLSYNREETQSAIDLTKIDPLISSLKTFATSLRTSWQDDMNAIVTASQSLCTRIEDAVISTQNGDNYRKAGGLSVYFPTNYYNSNYDQTDLAKNTPWNEFLADYRETMSSSWIATVRNQTLYFYEPDYIDLHHFASLLSAYDPDDFKPQYTVEETTYAFDDIQSTGTRVSIPDEENIQINPSNFSFSYHDSLYETFYISGNGVIFFENMSSSCYSNGPIPGNNAFNSIFIAPYWEDLNDADVFWELKNTESEKKLIIQWQDVSHYDYDSSFTITFQAILYENGRISFQYKDTEFGNEQINYGNSATVGLQGSESSGLQYSFDQPKIKSPFALLFIPEDESGCHYSLASYHHTISARGETRNLVLTTDAECQWEVSSNASWINILSEKIGTGSAQIKFQIAENKNLVSRSGQLNIADRVVTIEQESPCVYSISPLKQPVSASGGIKQLTLNTSLPDCPWSVESHVQWIQLIELSGTGSGIISYSVSKNVSMNKRTGTIAINNEIVTIIQNASESLEAVLLENHSTLKNLSLNLSGRLYYKIEIPPDHYSFRITTNSGTGDCDIYVSKDQIPDLELYDYSSERYGNEEDILIAEPTDGTWYIMLYAYEHFNNVNLNVSYESQQCDYTLSQNYFEFSSAEVSGEVQVMTDDHCLWFISNYPPWIDIQNVSETYQGNVTLFFTLQKNSSPDSRTGFIDLANQSIEIVQQGNANIDIQLLENITPLSNLFGSEKSYQYYKMIVPDNQEELVVKTWGGTGDCDLYISYNDFPNDDTSDFSSTNYNNAESIVIQHPQAGEYIILLFGYEAYSNISLQAEYRSASCTYSFSETEIYMDSEEAIGQIDVATQHNCSWHVVSKDSWISILSETVVTGNATISFQVSPNNGNSQRTGAIEVEGTLIFITQQSSFHIVDLLNDNPLTGISILQDEQLFFVIDVPANQKNLIIDSWNGTGDVDLYAHYGRLPTDITPDYKCYAWGNDENIYIKNPDEGQWFIIMAGFDSSENVSLKATYNALNCQYNISPMQLTIDSSGGTGAINVFVNEGCSWTTIKHGTWIEIDNHFRRGTGNGYAQYTITANDSPTIRTNNIRVADQWVVVMQSGTNDLNPTFISPETPINISGQQETSQYFQIFIPDQTTMVFNTSGGIGDCDLYIRHGILPTFRQYDYRPYIYGNDEKVVIENARSGIWYAMIYGDSDFENVQFKVLLGNAYHHDNLSNLIQVLQLLAGMNTNAVDVNMNGRVDIEDAMIILRAFE
jgi:hypothetical protein